MGYHLTDVLVVNTFISLLLILYYGLSLILYLNKIRNDPQILNLLTYVFAFAFKFLYGVSELSTGIYFSNTALTIDGMHMTSDSITNFIAAASAIYCYRMHRKTSKSNQLPNDDFIKFEKFEVLTSVVLATSIMMIGFISLTNVSKEFLFLFIEGISDEINYGMAVPVAFGAIAVNLMELTIYKLHLEETESLKTMIIHLAGDCIISIFVVLQSVLSLSVEVSEFNLRISDLAVGVVISIGLFCFGAVSICRTIPFVIDEEIEKESFAEIQEELKGFGVVLNLALKVRSDNEKIFVALFGHYSNNRNGPNDSDSQPKMNDISIKLMTNKKLKGKFTFKKELMFFGQKNAKETPQQNAHRIFY